MKGGGDGGRSGLIQYLIRLHRISQDYAPSGLDGGDGRGPGEGADDDLSDEENKRS